MATLKRMFSGPHGAVRTDEPPLKLDDGTIVESYERSDFDDVRSGQEPHYYERATRPDGRIEWFELMQ